MIFDKSKFEKLTKPRKLKYIQENDFFGFNTKNAVMVLYCIENGLTDVVYAPCGAECKITSTKPSKYCNSYKNRKEETCPLCHNYYKNTMQEKYKESCTKKYGVENPMKNAEIREIYKQNFIDKTGYTNPLCTGTDSRTKRDQTCIVLFGSVSSQKNRTVRDKTIKTSTEKFGTEHPMKNKNISTKAGNNLSLVLNKKKTKRILENLSDGITFIDDEKLKFNQEYEFRCDKCNNIFKHHIWNLGTKKISCPICFPRNNNSSMQENEIRVYIESFGLKTISTKNIIHPYEIDIYIPELKIGFEYNGSYWHSTKFVDKNYHLMKLELAEKCNVHLINIHEVDYQNNKEVILSRIKNVLGFSESTYARSCTIKEVGSKEEKEFLNKNHLQGYVNSKLCYGLYHDDVLMAVMSFGKTRYDKNDDGVYELLRYCSSGTVIGGASRLLKHFEKYNKPKRLISYASRDWTSINNNLYKTLEFEFVKSTKPSYFYEKNNTKFSRYQCTLKKLYKNDPSLLPNLTEDDITIGLYKFNKIYTTGNLKYEKNYK